MITDVPLKAKVEIILERHIGPQNHIKAGELAARLGFNDDREIRLAIRELISDGVPIVSDSYGYYIADAYSQVEEYTRSLKNRVINDALRIRDVKKSFGLYWNGEKQGKLM